MVASVISQGARSRHSAAGARQGQQPITLPTLTPTSSYGRIGRARDAHATNLAVSNWPTALIGDSYTKPALSID